MKYTRSGLTQKQNKSIGDSFRNSGVIREPRLALINELGLSDMIRTTTETLGDNRTELFCRVIIPKPLDDKLRNEFDSRF
jgi:hypothetical protein